MLNTGLHRARDKPLCEQKCSALFERSYQSNPDRDAIIYAMAN